ncbi:DUF6082 family protein [Kitasatospora sp. NPDC056651]|uniref:DUF6082 family protein n=1 Tax=Kitasatospora sp. NPDC056651 TaxID=3345892 RepID=UPI0036C121B2
MRTAHAVLLGAGLLAGVNAVRLAVDHQDRNRQLVLDAADMHQQLMRDGEAHPERYADHPTLGQLSETERWDALRTNRMLALLCAKYQSAVMGDDELLHNLVSMVHVPAARAYWVRSGSHWISETASGAPRVREFGRHLKRTFERADVEPAA